MIFNYTLQPSKQFVNKLIYEEPFICLEPSMTAPAKYTLFIDKLFIMVTSTHMLQKVHGVLLDWTDNNLLPPHFQNGNVYVKAETEEELEFMKGGLPLDISHNSDVDWSAYWDSENKCFCLGERNTSPHDNAIQFSPQSVVVLSEGKLKSIWLFPQEYWIGHEPNHRRIY